MKAEVLRKSILQMAIQGKLVPQNNLDEPASVLLQKIRAEKENLIKEGKIKRDKIDSAIFKGEDGKFYEKTGKEVKDITDQLSFEIPESWTWSRLGDISTYNQRKEKIAYLDISADMWSLDLEDIEKDTGKIINICKASERGISGDKIKFYKGQILYSKLRPYLKKILVAPDNGICSSEIVPFNMFGNVNAKYVIYFLKSPYVDFIVNSVTYGVKMPRVGTETMLELLLPVPPLEEQKRIVEAIEKFEPLLAEYDKLEQQAEKLDGEIFDKLKKSILQYAIQGKLVPQDSSDEPASVLLSKIKAEKEKLIKEGKIKKEKPLPPIIDSEKPFDIPDSWQWVRLGNVFNIVSARRVHQSDWRDKGIPFYRAREIAKLAMYGYVKNELFITNELFKKLSVSGIPKVGDLMVTAVGTIGKTYVVRKSDVFYYKDASVICLENIFNINPFFIKYLMETSYMEKQIIKESAGTTVNTITIDKANQYFIPLPPLNEQKRIVARIEEIFTYINIKITS